MLVIRFFRVGKKNQPSFKIVVTDKRRPARAGRFREEVGFYNPLTKEKVLKAERIKYWISKGAKLSATVNNLLVQEKVLEGKKIAKHKISKKEAVSGADASGIPAGEKPVEKKEEAQAEGKPETGKPEQIEEKREEIPAEKAAENPPEEAVKPSEEALDKKE